MKSFKYILLLALISFLHFAWACTGLQLKAKDGTAISGRTVEFGMNLDLSGLIIPRGYPLKGSLPDGGVGMNYKAKYAAVGGALFGEIAIADGMNEKGLSVGAFYFPDYADYAEITPQNKDKALSPTEFPTWIVTQFATVDEVRQALNAVVIVPTIPKGWPALPPFHYVVYDKAGKSITIEPIHGQLKVYDNPLGVLTNSPTFDWQITNLANYINLSPINTLPVNIEGVQLKQFGQGSGMHGLPGDFTPPSRFVRAAIFASSAVPQGNGEQTVLQVFHILNQFDIPYGAVREVEHGTVFPEYTLATVVRDPQNLKYYFKTYDDQSIKFIDLKAFDVNTKKVKMISMKGGQQLFDISQTAG